jgi:hypothetical protein
MSVRIIIKVPCMVNTLTTGKLGEEATFFGLTHPSQPITSPRIQINTDHDDQKASSVVHITGSV